MTEPVHESAVPAFFAADGTVTGDDRVRIPQIEQSINRAPRSQRDTIVSGVERKALPFNGAVWNAQLSGLRTDREPAGCRDMGRPLILW